MTPGISFEDYSYLEAAPLPLQERPAPHPFRCPYAQEEELCVSYTPVNESDLCKKVLSLQKQPGVRCLLVGLPTEELQGPYPIEPMHLAYWCGKYREGLPFHLQPLRSGRRHPCGDEPACRSSPQIQARETEQMLARSAAVTRQLDTQIRELFPGLGGKRNPEQRYAILHAWATQEEPGKSHLAIAIPTLVKKFNLKDRSTIYRVLNEAKAINPQVYAHLEKVRTDRARITRGGEVRTV